MSQNRKSYYTNSYLLESIIMSQQNIPRKYKTNDYFGSCMRSQENEVASLLEQFINDVAVVLPQDYELFATMLYTLRSSGHKYIKRYLPRARKKFDKMYNQWQEQQNIAKQLNPIDSDGNVKYAILDNKKKMLQMSCTDLCAFGDAINNERGFNTTRIKNKFAAFVSYRIELVLSGKMQIDADFPVLLNKYGTPGQKNLYSDILSNRLKSYTPVVPQTTNQSHPQPKTKKKEQPKKQTVKKQSIIKSILKPKQTTQQTTQHTTQQPTEKKSKPGFFSRIGKSVKNTFNKLKKPALIAGIFALTIFGGKKAYDAAVESEGNNFNTEYYTTNTPHTKSATQLNVSESVRDQNQTTVVDTNKRATTPTNDVMVKTVAQLQKLKANNPIDRNMDVNATANRLYQRFGDKTYDVVLSTLMAPYALNEYTQFNFTPKTHNMIEYLSTHDLTPEQKNALNAFIAQHVSNGKINMTNIMNQLNQRQR